MPKSTTLKQLGFRPKQKTPVQRFFDAHRGKSPVKPDVDYHPDADRVPQAPSFAGMWIDHFNNLGNVKNPVGSPMESGA